MMAIFDFEAPNAQTQRKLGLRIWTYILEQDRSYHREGKWGTMFMNQHLESFNKAS